MILVIGAMKEELIEIIQNNEYKKIKDELGIEYHDLKQKYVVVISKIGLVNASLSLSHWLTKYPLIKQILVLGTAGSLTPYLKQGDECYIKKATYGGVDATAFNYQYGQVPQMPINYNGLISQSYLSKNLHLKATSIVSLDNFINQKEQATFLNQKLKQKYDLVDMETTAFCQTAFRFNKPISIIKIVSDSLYQNKNPALAFDKFLPQAAHRLNFLFNQYLENSELLK